MRFMLMFKPDADPDPGVHPCKQTLPEMAKLMAELRAAGVLLASEGLQPSDEGARVRLSGGRRTVIDGPFAEAKELVGGFWMWQVKSIDEAVEWLQRAPFDKGVEIEIRPIFEETDFVEAMG